MEITEERVREIVREEIAEGMKAGVSRWLAERGKPKPPWMSSTEAALLRSEGKDPMDYA